MESDTLSPEERAFNEMSPVDQLTFERELANKRVYSPEEAKKNIAETLMGLAYSTPGIANSMSIRDAFEAKEAAAKSSDPQEAKRLNAQAVTAALSAFLPFSIGSPSAGSAARLGVFAPVAEGSKASRARSVFKEVADALGPEEANKAVRKETGLLFGPEGALKREIIDNPNMRIKGDFSAGQSAKLDDVIDHPELFQSFPEYRDINVRFISEQPGRARYSGTDPNTGDFIFDDKFAGDNLRVQIAKNLQYRINKEQGWVNAAREGVNAKVRDANRAIEQVQRAVAEGKLSDDIGSEYADFLRRTIAEAKQTRSELTVSPGSFAEESGHSVGERLLAKTRRKLEHDFWTKRSAGKQETKQVKYRAYSPERTEEFPAHLEGDRYSKAAVIPHGDMTGDQIAAFVKAWKEYGSGRVRP